MLKNYLITNLRALWKKKGHTLINMVGLSLGITCTIIIFVVIKFELSFDNYHPDKERIYRVITEYLGDDKPGYNSGVTYPLPEALKQDFPDFEYVILTDANMSDPVISIADQTGGLARFKESRAVFVDPDYFKLFQYDWIEGDNDALTKEFTAAISVSTAKKYFGNTSAIGKTITFNSKGEFTITGVFADPPLNTDFPFTVILTSKLGADRRWWTDWGSTSSSLNCYVKLREGITQAEFEKKLIGWHEKFFQNEDTKGKDRKYLLQPLSSLHFDTRFGNYGRRVVSEQTLLAIGSIGFFLLITACINFVNLNTVLIVSRAKEAGVRKVLGGSRSHLVIQFLGETFMVTAVSLIISLGLAELAMINMTPILGYSLGLHFFKNIETILFLFTLPFIVTILAGLYPGILLSSFQPVKALKGKLSIGYNDGVSLRRVLVILQLVISQVMIISTAIIIQQMNHFSSQPLGLDSKAVVEFEIPEREPEKLKTLKERLLNLKGVEYTSFSSSGSASGSIWGSDYKLIVNQREVKDDADVKFADEDYLEAYGIKFMEGERLSKSDTLHKVLVNEAFVKTLGVENNSDAIGLEMDFWGKKVLISGVVKDFHARSLKSELKPLIIGNSANNYFVCAVKLNTTEMTALIPEIEKIWLSVFPNYVFEHEFLDETIKNFYSTEKRNGILMSVFAVIAIIIGCIGLLGLVSFMATQKTKEIGIRKTLGASTPQIISIFSREFLILILISFVIAVPIAYYVMDGWLSNFTYRIHPGALTFLSGAMVSLVVVLSTVGFRSYRAAVANPIDSLKDE